MDTTTFFSRLWDEYIKITPQAEAIQKLFLGYNSEIINDHVAFRTFDIAPLNIDTLEPIITGLGYQLSGHYQFPEKRLLARSYVSAEQSNPRFFISELVTHSLTEQSQEIIRSLCRQVNPDNISSPEIFLRGRLWKRPTWEQYQTLLNESDYAAWLSSMGLRANHFTISINHLDYPDSLIVANDLLKQAGFELNDNGGEIKGSAEVCLEQSSTKADKMSVEFADGDRHQIATCYYEFAKRYKDSEGNLFQGFVAASADKIFESTDTPRKDKGLP